MILPLSGSGLAVRGVARLRPDDGFGEGFAWLLGPDEPSFWPLFTSSAEYGDGARDPLDRWSARVVGMVADRAGGRAVMPSDGPPYPPFIAWALRSGAAWQSPVGLLVHEDTGLFLSFRGAVLVPFGMPGSRAEPPAESPCESCEGRPCLTACPVGAMGAERAYDVPACKSHVRAHPDADCRSGCLVRRACPLSARLNRSPAQSAFHMAAFLGN